MRAVRILFAIAVVGIVGCRPTYPDGVFACTDDAQCPGELRCSAGFCSRTVSDAAVVVDGGPHDGSVAVDAASPDASCPTCASIRVTNAAPGHAFDDVSIGGTALGALGYGSTTSELSIALPVGDTMFTSMEHGSPSTVGIALSPGQTYTIAYLVDATGAAVPQAFLHPASTGGPGVALRYAFHPTGGGVVVEHHGMTLHDGSDDAVEASPTPILVHDDTSMLLLAAMPSTLPGSDGDFYYVFVVGDRDAHLANAGALRLVPGIHGASAIASGSLITLYNEANASVFLCDGASSISSIAPGLLGDLLPAIDGHGSPIVLGFGMSCVSATAVDGLTGDPGRVLVAVTGTTSLGSLRAVLGREADDHAAMPAVLQGVTLVNPTGAGPFTVQAPGTSVSVAASSSGSTLATASWSAISIALGTMVANSFAWADPSASQAAFVILPGSATAGLPIVWAPYGHPLDLVLAPRQ